MFKLYSTAVTHSDPLRSISVYRPGDLDEIGRTSVAQRAVGTSTVHSQSSRSHAIMRLEVVNAAVLAARAALTAATSLLPARKNALDNLTTIAGKLLFLPGQQPMLRVVPLPSDTDVCGDAPGEAPGEASGEGAAELKRAVERGSEDLIWNPQICQGWAADGWPVTDGVSGAVLWKLLEFPDEGSKTCAAWATRLGVTRLRYERTTVKRVFPDGGSLWQTTHASLSAQRGQLLQLLADAQAGVGAARAALAAASSGAAMASLGGELLLVDLAGADYDHRAGAAQKESAAINVSLLALKECFRSIANVSGTPPKFRDSKLTRMLESALAPPTAKSGRRSNARASVMLVNVSPAADLEKGTINALRYGQLYAGSRGSAGGNRQANRVLGDGVGGRAPRAAGSSKPWLRSKRAAAPCDATIAAAVRAIYAEHVSDKSVEDVEAILKQFAGREETLLRKVGMKYAPETRYTIVPLTSDCLEPAIAILARAFHEGEPTTTATGVTMAGHLEFFELFAPQMANNDLSYAAIDTTSGAVAGVLIAEDFSSPEPQPAGSVDALLARHPGFGAVFALIEQAEHSYLESRGGGGHVEALLYCHLWCVAVDPAFSRRGIGGALTRRALDAARALGFRETFAEATGAFSARALAKCGMHAEATYPYAAVRDLAGIVAAPHVETALMVLKHL